MSITPRTHHGRRIDAAISIRTTPLEAWSAWADPERLTNWFADRAEGLPKAGETMTWIFDTFNYRIPVPILEAEPGRTFVTGSGDEPGPYGIPYLLEVTITREGKNSVVRLVNSGFSEDASRNEEYEGVVSGWHMALATLKRWLERCPEGRRTHLLRIKPATYEVEAMAPLFRAFERRAAWLFPDLPADAPVLCDTGREVLLAWDEREAVIGLKAFRMGSEQMIGLDFSSWATRPETGILPLKLDRTLDRLARAIAAT